MTDAMKIYDEQLYDRERTIERFVRNEVDSEWENDEERDELLDDISSKTIWINQTFAILKDIREMEKLREEMKNQYPQNYEEEVAR